jgi:hypothetical protein
MSGVSIKHLRLVFRDTTEYEKKLGGVEYCVNHCGICRPLVNHERKEVIFQNPYPFGNGLSGLLTLGSKCPLERESPDAITHLKIHRVWDENFEDCRKIVYAIAEHHCGEDGKKAVTLHLDLDFELHLINEVDRNIPKILTKNIKGTKKLWDEGRYLTIANLATRHLKNPPMLLGVLNGKNRDVFKHNLDHLLEMRLCQLIPRTRSLRQEIAIKTVKELIDEHGDKELGYLKELFTFFA